MAGKFRYPSGSANFFTEDLITFLPIVVFILNNKKIIWWMLYIQHAYEHFFVSVSILTGLARYVVIVFSVELSSAEKWKAFWILNFVWSFTCFFFFWYVLISSLFFFSFFTCLDDTRSFLLELCYTEKWKMFWVLIFLLELFSTVFLTCCRHGLRYFWAQKSRWACFFVIPF